MIINFLFILNHSRNALNYFKKVLKLKSKYSSLMNEFVYNKKKKSKCILKNLNLYKYLEYLKNNTKKPIIENIRIYD